MSTENHLTPLIPKTSPSPSPAPASLIELLDEIEREFELANAREDGLREHLLSKRAADVPALVKALHEAIDSLEAIAEPENKEPWSRDVAIEALEDLAQFLREPEKKDGKDLEEPRATS